MSNLSGREKPQASSGVAAWQRRLEEIGELTEGRQQLTKDNSCRVVGEEPLVGGLGFKRLRGSIHNRVAWTWHELGKHGTIAVWMPL